MFLINCYNIIKSLLIFNKNNPIFRMLFTFFYFYKHRQSLKKCLIYHKVNSAVNSKDVLPMEFNVDQVTLLELNSLKFNKIKILILDYDGVLSSYGESQPLPEVINWLERAILIFGPRKIFILSNNPSLIRKEFSDKYFNEKIIFVISQPKPYTDGIEYIKKYLLLEFGEAPINSEILLVDDRLATGILAAKIADIASCLILKPYINIKKKFIVEIVFIMFRKFERLILCHL